MTIPSLRPFFLAALFSACSATLLSVTAAHAAPRLIEPPSMRTLGHALQLRAKAIDLGTAPVTVVLTADRETYCIGRGHPNRRTWTRVTRRLESLKPEGGRIAFGVTFEPLPSTCAPGDRRTTRFTMARIRVEREGKEMLQRTYAPMGGPPALPRF